MMKEEDRFLVTVTTLLILVCLVLAVSAAISKRLADHAQDNANRYTDSVCKAAGPGK